MTLATEVPEGLAVVDADSHFTDVAGSMDEAGPRGLQGSDPARRGGRRGAPVGHRGHAGREGRRRKHHRPGGSEAPLPGIDDRVGLRAGPCRRVGRRRPTRGAGRDGHRAPGPLPKRAGTWWADPGRGEGPRAAPAVCRDLQRHSGRDPGAHQQPSAAHAHPARLGHRRVRPRGRTDREASGSEGST